MGDPDFIVVGAGTAGCVLAGRLTDNDANSVLLIEAGEPPSNPFVSMPAGFTRLFRSKHDWALESEPQMHKGRRVFTPRGRMLGGSSNMNAQIHQWCHPADFDEWSAEGCAGWSWEDVSPHFIAQEKWIGEKYNRPRGESGPMQVAPNDNINPASRAFVASARANGLDGPDDYNGGAFEGAWIVQIAHKGGKRFSAYNAYLQPAMSRRSLEILTGGLVETLLFEGKKCVGVNVRCDGQSTQYRASRGVILTAGAFGSPHILMLSGIGPAAHLAEHGIEVLTDLHGVGNGLQDHPTAALVFTTKRKDTFKIANSPPNLLRYILLKKGPLASNAIEAFAFSRVGDSEPAPNLEIMFAPLEWRNQALEKPQIHALTMASAVVKPKSRGSVKLKSNDPAASPAIDFALLSDPDRYDARVLLAGLRLIRTIAATKPLSEDIVEETQPSRNCQSDEELLDFVADACQTVYHPASTCQMGVGPHAVTGPDLRVRGLDGLWVADASVMPSVPRGHPNAVVAMIADRAASALLQNKQPA